jgi:hypothetical protein
MLVTGVSQKAGNGGTVDDLRTWLDRLMGAVELLLWHAEHQVGGEPQVSYAAGQSC